MTEEEKKIAAEAAVIAAAEAAKKEGEGDETIIEIDPITKLEEEKAKLIEERDNYKAVALKRLGKLPGDANFLQQDTSELSVEEQVKLILLQKEIDANEKAKIDEAKKLAREVAELRLALKNRPDQGIGGDSGATVEVKDNILSDKQIKELTARAISLKADPQKFIENFKKTLRSRS